MVRPEVQVLDQVASLLLETAMKTEMMMMAGAKIPGNGDAMIVTTLTIFVAMKHASHRPNVGCRYGKGNAEKWQRKMKMLMVDLLAPVPRVGRTGESSRFPWSQI